MSLGIDLDDPRYGGEEDEYDEEVEEADSEGRENISDEEILSDDEELDSQDDETEDAKSIENKRISDQKAARQKKREQEKNELQNVMRVIVVAPDERVTSNRINKHECVRVLQIRAKHIEDGRKIFLPNGYGNLSNALDIAEKELLDGYCPLTVVRKVFQTDKEVYVEHWPVRELAIPKEYITTL